MFWPQKPIFVIIRGMNEGMPFGKFLPLDGHGNAFATLGLRHTNSSYRPSNCRLRALLKKTLSHYIALI